MARYDKRPDQIDAAQWISRCDADTFDAAYVPTTNR